MRRLFALIMLLALPVQAEEIVAGLSQNRVAINANFDGSEILIFGAVKREAPIPNDGALGVIVTVEGPGLPVTLRRKDKKLGIWINTDSVDVVGVPTFYAVASSAPVNQLLSPEADQEYNISIPRMVAELGTEGHGHDPLPFTEALIRIRENEGSYISLPRTVSLDQETLFETSIALPANLTEGNYTTKFYLTRNGTVIDQSMAIIDVRKVGLERFLFTLAHERPLVYGILSLFIAIVAGWGASAIFRYFRP